MDQFEYFTTYMKPSEKDEFKKQMDAMGRLGWDLVKIITENEDEHGKVLPKPKKLAIFKRLIPLDENKQRGILHG